MDSDKQMYDLWKTDGNLGNVEFARYITQELGEELSQIDTARVEKLKKWLREVVKKEPDTPTPGFTVTINGGYTRTYVKAEKLLALMDMIREVSPACASIIEQEVIEQKDINPEPAIEWLGKKKRGKS